MNDEYDSGIDFWQSLTDLQLELIINSPHGFLPGYRAFAAQELQNRGLKSVCVSTKVDPDVGNGSNSNE